MNVVLKPWLGLTDSLDIFSIQIEQEIKKEFTYKHTDRQTDGQIGTQGKKK